MENLNKQQIVLLTLLVSFVTSIATGIVTVSLMNQAPVGVTQTINRVVERTVEKIVPSNNNGTVKETIVVSSDDQTVSAINNNLKSVVRIYRTNTDPSAVSSSMVFVGVGVVVADDGMIATDNSLIAEGGKYFITLGGSKLHDLLVLRAKTGEQIALLKIKPDEKDPLSLPKASISSGDLKLGQSVAYIGGDAKDVVATGIVSSLGMKDVIASSTTATSTDKRTVVVSVETTIPSNNFVTGGILLNLSGELVGIKSTFMDSAKTNLFAPSSDIKVVLAAYAESQKKSQ